MFAQILNILLGLWLMSAPEVLDYGGHAADIDHIVGPIVVTFAVVALSGATRSVAYFNLPIGIWLVLAPWLLGYEDGLIIVHELAIGASVSVLSLFRRKSAHRYGGGWRSVFKHHDIRFEK